MKKTMSKLLALALVLNTLAPFAAIAEGDAQETPATESHVEVQVVTVSEPKAEAKQESAPAPAAESKPAEPKSEPASEPKAEAKQESVPTPAAESKPAEPKSEPTAETKQESAPAPAAESKPAEPKAEAKQESVPAPAAESKPAEPKSEAKAEETKAESAPKAEETAKAAEAEKAAEPEKTAGNEKAAEPVEATETEKTADPAKAAEAEQTGSAATESEPETEAGPMMAAEQPEARGETETEEAASPSGITDIAEIERPAQSESVETHAGGAGSDNWDGFYDEAKKTYQVTYTIKEDAEGDQTLDLSGVLDKLSGYADAAYEGYEGRNEALNSFLTDVAGDNSLSNRENALRYLEEQGMDTEDPYVRRYADYMVNSADYAFVRDNYPSYYLDYYFPNGNPFAPSLGTAQADAVNLLPGDTVQVDITIESESGHTYCYKDGSLTLATPDLSGSGAETGVTGFDGQELPEDYLNDGVNRVGYNTGIAAGTVRAASAILESDPEAEIDVEALLDDPIAILVYRAQLEDAAKQTERNVAYYGGGRGTPGLYKNLTGHLTEAEIYALYSLSNSPSAYATMTRNNQAVAGYLQAHYGAEGEDAYKAYLLDYYAQKDGVAYADFDELAEKSTVISDLKATTNATYGTITLPEYTDYNNFYKNLLSFAYGDEAIAQADASDSWDSDGHELTVGDYMAGMTDNTGAWARANEYFDGLLAQGLSEDDASWVAFSMAFNVDGIKTGNDYQLTSWGWHNSIVLDQVDGEFHLEKTDEDGNRIEKKEDGSANETTFRLWTYEDTDGDGSYTERDDKYYYTTTTAADGSETRGFVKYDKANQNLTYTIDTTGGKLDIDYALLEGIIYYLQEAVAPEGYDIDTTVYILCDDEETAALAQEMLKDAGVDTSAGFEYKGAIDSDKPLTVKVVNKKSVKPDPAPDPEKPAGGNPTNDTPTRSTRTTVTIGDYEIPLAGYAAMNEGDCYN